MKLAINYRFIVGIDISKETLDLHLLDHTSGHMSETQVANDQQGFAQLGRWLADNNVNRSQAVLCSEHCGRYEEHLVRWSTETG